eukprot:350965-Chlamydomonas_euryale.AAC.3
MLLEQRAPVVPGAVGASVPFAIGAIMSSCPWCSWGDQHRLSLVQLGRRGPAVPDVVTVIAVLLLPGLLFVLLLPPLLFVLRLPGLLFVLRLPRLLFVLRLPGDLTVFGWTTRLAVAVKAKRVAAGYCQKAGASCHECGSSTRVLTIEASDVAAGYHQKTIFSNPDDVHGQTARPGA